MRTWPNGFAESPIRGPEERRRCTCGAVIARDNKGADRCSPCVVSEERRILDTLVREREEREALKKRMDHLMLGDVPLACYPDIFPPEIVRLVVLHYGRTGNKGEAARRVKFAGLNAHEARLCLGRRAAREMIELMREEGTWPNSPNGKNG